MKGGVSSKGFKALVWSQALGVFNDNAFKSLIALWAVSSFPPEKSTVLIASAGALFTAPFILFSTTAGVLADRVPKKTLLVSLKAAELLIMLGTGAVFALHSVPLSLFILFLLGTHSAFLGPVKLSYLPDILEENALSEGNGIMQSSAFAAILTGTIAAGIFLERWPFSAAWAGLFLSAIAALGLSCALNVPEVPASSASRETGWNALRQTRESFSAIRRHPGVFQASVASAYFWFVAAVLQMNLLAYGTQLMGLSETQISLFQAAAAIGIGLGSWGAGKLSRDRVELGLVPAGAFLIVLFSVGLAFSFRSTGLTAVLLALLGAACGCYAVPLAAFIQEQSPEGERGRFIAAGSLLAFLGILAASGALWAFSAFFSLHPGQIFLAIAAMTAVVAVYISVQVPDSFIRLCLYPIAHCVYKIDLIGAANIPLKGPALIVANHVSYADAFLIAAASRRMVRFLMFKPYYEHPLMNPLCRAMGVIPIADTDSPKELIRSFERARAALESGEVVCIFAEGQMTRTGQMLRLKKGFERILKGTKEVPIIAAHLDRIWGSLFSFEGGRFFFKTPRRFPYPVTVSFAPGLPASADAHTVRQRILELGSEAFRRRLLDIPSLPAAFLRAAKKGWARVCLSDSSGVSLTRGELLVKATLFAKALRRAAAHNDAPIAILLPPGVPAAVANAAVSLMGRAVVNLNYTISEELAFACAEKAGSAVVVTSRRFLERLGWRQPSHAFFIEDVPASINRIEAAAVWAACRLLPRFLLEAFLPRIGLDSPAAVIFTSGSTGIPRGAVLTHANIQSNIEGLGQVFSIRRDDAVLSALPFFHAFGFTGGLWLPLISGFRSVLHSNPLEAKRIGELASKERATILIGTPSFLGRYAERVPREHFSSLRLVISGAEKLRPELAKRFQERFGILPLEGYGATELSPVAAVNIPDFVSENGVQPGGKPGTTGHPLPGVLMKIVHPESRESLPVGTSGLLLVKGPNVMSGYLDDPQGTAAAIQDGYFVTGDIASIDEDGFVTISDRIARFSKVAGEMVPHEKIEEALDELYAAKERAFFVTGVPDPERGERLVVLHSAELDPLEALSRLRGYGIPPLWLPDRSAFRKIAALPVLGSGKIDQEALKKIALEEFPA